MAVIGVVLIALPEQAASLSAADSSRWRLSQATDQSATTAPPSVTEEGTPAITEDGTPATVMDDREVEGILGKSVRSSAGEDMGHIVDVIVKRNDQVRAAVIDFGGFLGVGSRTIAVDWSALRFPPSGKIDHVILELTRDQVRLAPEYKPGEPVVVLGTAGTTPAAPENPAPGN
jgi:sporulation protein YlmC with PRC-barrel domain